MSVVDIGAGSDPDSRADIAVDKVDLSTVDVVHDLEERPWPFEAASVDCLIASHVVEHLQSPASVFEEAARVLADDGMFELTVPIGLDARTDPTHVSEWTWDTPTYFTDDPPYEYGWGLPFELVNRHADWWLDGPFAVGTRLIERFERQHGPGKWLSSVPGLSGELTAVYRRCPR